MLPAKSINYYYAILTDFSKQLGELCGEEIQYRNLHAELKNKLLSGKSVRKLSFNEFADYIEAIKAYAAITFNIYLKDSNETK